MRIRKVVSGGQTGVDRVALDVAIHFDIEHGGWCPLDRIAEDGTIPDVYQLKEMPVRDYVARTEQNVIDSDGTLILYRGKMTGGTRLTFRLTQKHGRPVHAIDLDQHVELREISTWIEQNNLKVLNIAGPRASSSPGIEKYAEELLLKVFSNCESEE